jgi:hypothetical protein
MLKRDITFETLNDPPETITKTFYFNLTMPEFAALNPDVDPNMTAEEAVNSDLLSFVAKADDLILYAYGVKSEDGLNFEKSDELREKFKSSVAYAALVDELLTEDNAFTTFLRGILPAKFGAGLDKAMLDAKTELQAISPPVPPTLKD